MTSGVAFGRLRLTIALLTAALPVGSFATSTSDSGPRELLDAAVTLSGRGAPAGLPPLAPLDLQALVRKVCGGSDEDCKGLMAAYDAATRTVYYRDSLRLDHPLDRSFLVHELVHYLQHLEAGDAFRTADCLSTLASEREAYDVQNRYLREHGQRRRVGQSLLFTQCDAADGPPAAHYDTQRNQVVLPPR